MNHINFARLVALVLLGAAGAFAAAFWAYIQGHPLPQGATADVLLSNLNAAAFDGAQRGVGAAALALVAGLTRTDAGTPANGLRPPDAPIAETQQTVGVEMGQELTERLAAAIAQAITEKRP